MILDHISNASRYYSCHSDFVAAFSFLQECNLPFLSEGRHSILGDRIYAIVAKTKGKGAYTAKLEAHKEYIDIQYIIRGKDTMGWRSLGLCKNCSEPYQKDKDIMFFSDPPNHWIEVTENHFAVFFPEDSHAPLAGEEEVWKIVIKIAVTPQHTITY